ncbi:hypothetical protein [Nocardia sp. NPDC006630]|uniref:hypothetical protein n=1 Tax=Nocardia sp. NPDC006630 TaxID=3157181 RepID=UPI0033BE28CD
MPSPLHEVLLELFTNQPGLAASLLSALGWDLPEYEEANTACTDLTDKAPTEYRADTVVVFSNSKEPVLAVVVEVQLRPDKDKRWTWPVYVATLRARLRCPTVLLVLTPDNRTTTWAAKPIDLGFGVGSVQPVVLGPEQVPVVTDPASAVRTPELAVLSAIAHQGSKDRSRVFAATLAALDKLAAEPGSRGTERATMYYDLVTSTLNHAARSCLEAMMTTAARREYLSDTFRNLVKEGLQQGREQGLEEGRVDGEVRILETILDARGFVVSAEVRARIEGCTDVDQLEVWARRAVTAADVAEIFE